jgi:hypothetical protein
MVKLNGNFRIHADLNRIDFFPKSCMDIEKLCQLTGMTDADGNRSSFTNVIQAFSDRLKEKKAGFLKICCVSTYTIVLNA